MITAETSLTDVAGAVAATLRTLDYDPVVVGGSAATINAPEAYRSDDIDIVILGGIDESREGKRELIAAMKSLGFRLQNAMWFHSSNRYTVEFVPSPVAIANDILSDFAIADTPFGPVRVLHAVDAVCDRLNKYVAYKDPDSLEAAITVARSCKVDLSKVEAFALRHAVGVFADPFLRAYRRFHQALVPQERSVSEHSFTTTLRLWFAADPDEATVNDVQTRIREMLDSERSQIAGLDGVDVGGDITIHGDVASVVLRLRATREGPFVEKLGIAIDSIAYIRSRIQNFPELLDVLEDDAPPIVSTGA